MKLSELKIKDRGRVLEVNAQGDIRKRLLDMGLIRGACFRVLRKAPLGDPIEIKLRGFNLSLRVEEAQTIIVDRIDEKCPCLENKNIQKRHCRWGWFE